MMSELRLQPSNAVAIYIVWANDLPIYAFPFMEKAKEFASSYLGRNLGASIKITKMSLLGNFVVSSLDTEHMAQS